MRTPFPLPCPLVNPSPPPYSPPSPPSPPPPSPPPPPLLPSSLLFLNPHPTVPMRLSSPPFTHIQRFFRRHRRRHLGSGFVALCSDSTSQNHPPDPTSPPSFVTVEAWACQWTVYVWWPAAGLSNMTHRDFDVGQVALLKLLNAGFAPHGCGRDSNFCLPKELSSIYILSYKSTSNYGTSNNFLTFGRPSQPVCQSETSYKIGLGMRPV